MEKWRQDLRNRIFGEHAAKVFAKPSQPLTEQVEPKIKIVEAAPSAVPNPYRWKRSSLQVEGGKSPYSFDWGSRVVAAKRDKTENVLMVQKRKDALETKTRQVVTENLESQPKFTIL